MLDAITCIRSRPRSAKPRDRLSRESQVRAEQDLKRIEFQREVLRGRWTVIEAAKMLRVTEQHSYRLLMKYQEQGGTALVQGTWVLHS